MTYDPQRMAKNNGGYWGSHLDYPVSDWIADVMEDGTRQGYWKWVCDRVRDAAEEIDR